LELLDSLAIRKKGSQKEYLCQMYLLNESHYPQVAELQEQVISNLDDKEIFFPLTPAELKNILSGEGGLGIGAFVADKLIGFRSLYYPKNSEDNLGKDIGLPAALLMQVAHLEASFVHPNFQGNSLQKKMTSLILSRLTSLNQFRHVLSTVMPKNMPSIIDKFAQKMIIMDLKEKYNSGWRYIFYRNLAINQELKCNQVISVLSTDIARQIDLLNNGFRGIGYKKSAVGIDILFAQHVW